MLCIIPHIREYVFKNAQKENHIQLNNVIKTLFAVSTEKELHGALDKFWSEYTLFKHKNDTFDSNGFIWNSKILLMVTVIYDIRNTHYHPPEFLVL